MDGLARRVRRNKQSRVEARWIERPTLAGIDAGFLILEPVGRELVLVARVGSERVKEDQVAGTCGEVLLRQRDESDRRVVGLW